MHNNLLTIAVLMHYYCHIVVWQYPFLFFFFVIYSFSILFTWNINQYLFIQDRNNIQYHNKNRFVYLNWKRNVFVLFYVYLFTWFITKNVHCWLIFDKRMCRSFEWVVICQDFFQSHLHDFIKGLWCPMLSYSTPLITFIF